ncbi:MAG: flagellar biosynthetic protein FliO [Lachnospiraceae bacterium]|nr:flagellar biosynthetic protein FliO [Lachnospiraceae bacterium]
MLLTVSDGINSFAQFLTVLIIFLFVLAITYITTRYIAKIEKNRIVTGNMELIEALRISVNKYLQIVKVGNKYLCIAVCKDTITMLTELEEEEIKIVESDVASIDFRKIMERMKMKNLSTDQETNEENRP